MAIEIQDLNLKYPDAEQKLFNDLSLSVETHEKILLVGPSGSGKSTLLNVMGQLIPSVIDVPMKAKKLETSGSGAFVFQDPDSQFTMPTIAEELAFLLENQQVPRAEMDARFKEVLETVGLDVDINMHINKLSGGMKQKLAIAGTLLQGSDTLFLDEPTSMLDSDSARHLWETIVNIWSDKTVVIVEHRVEHIWDIVDRVILMDHEGSIIFSGTPGEVLGLHLDLLDEYGVWHPKSWESAPVLDASYTKGEVMLKLSGVVVTRSGRPIVDVGDVSIHKGEWITLEGDNGTGRTSLLLSIMKLIKHTGAVYFGERLIKKTKDYKGKVFPVFQNPELQFMTNNVVDEVAINFELADGTDVSRQKALRLLEQFGIAHLSHLHPLEISTGQKRRLSVATAMSQTPRIILFDEPTFGLDRNNTFNLLEMFDGLVRDGVTIIMITHDEEIKQRYPSRRLRIESQRLTEAGGHDV